ncbi:MAG: hypothetical protein AMXMBFR84_40640 [Candidatus Hydrogenedentota bacterium]
MTTHAERMVRFDHADLYVVITESFCGGRSALDVLDAVLDAGVTLIQLREKDWDDCRLYRHACQFRERTARVGALLIIDDRIDMALAAEADGVHLGQTDLPIEAARGIAPDLIIGASTHNLDEALAAQAAGASYLNIGPIFATQTKTGLGSAVGPDMITAIAPRLRVPFTVMGGIKEHNIHEVITRGARRAAVVTAVTQDRDPGSAARRLREAFSKPRC